MNDIGPCHAYHAPGAGKETPWGSCQVFGGREKLSPLGAFYCDLDCQFISTDDKLSLCQVGRDSSDEPTVNSLEITREDKYLVFEMHVEAIGGFQDIVCRRASGKNIKLSIEPDADKDGSYKRIRFMVYDADIREAMYRRAYALPASQGIDRVAIALKPRDGYGGGYRPTGLAVGVNNFRAYGTGKMPEILKPVFEWHGEEYRRRRGSSIVSKHYEGYKLNVLASLKQWKERT